MRCTQKPGSPYQLAANRANAAQSSGPETPGAVKHGVTDPTFAIARLEFYLVSVYQPLNSQGALRPQTHGPPPTSTPPRRAA